MSEQDLSATQKVNAAVVDRETLTHPRNHQWWVHAELALEIAKENDRLKGLLESQRIDLKKIGPEFRSLWQQSYKSPIYWQEAARMAMDEESNTQRECNQLRAELRETTMLCEAFCQSHTSIGLTLSELRTQLADEKMLLRSKNETANTFMSQVKKLQAELAAEKAKCEGLENLIVHAAIHENYRDNGFLQMTTEQKLIYVAIIGKSLTYTAARLKEFIDPAAMKQTP